jgi:hypothetical protein
MRSFNLSNGNVFPALFNKRQSQNTETLAFTDRTSRHYRSQGFQSRGLRGRVREGVYPGHPLSLGARGSCQVMLAEIFQYKIFHTIVKFLKNFKACNLKYFKKFQLCY